jgi:hypothetical protein
MPLTLRILFLIVIVVGFPTAVYLLFRAICRPKMQGKFTRVYEGITVARQPFPGAVHVVFHTYHGFLIYAHQVEHNVWAMPKDALLLLRRLHRFNVTHGFFAYGALFIPILSWFNYRSQVGQIERQTTG